MGRIGVVARLILALCFSIGDDTYHNPILASVFGDNQKPLGEHLCLLCVVLCPLTLWPPQSSWEILEGLTENGEHTGSKTTAPKSKEADVIYFLLVLHCILHPTLRENCKREFLLFLFIFIYFIINPQGMVQLHQGCKRHSSKLHTEL